MSRWHPVAASVRRGHQVLPVLQERIRRCLGQPDRLEERVLPAPRDRLAQIRPCPGLRDLPALQELLAPLGRLVRREPKALRESRARKAFLVTTARRARQAPRGHKGHRAIQGPKVQ